MIRITNIHIMLHCPPFLNEEPSLYTKRKITILSRFGKCVDLAELVLVTVPGSVEDERMFSTLKYICYPQRNRLQAQHLTCCAQGLKSSAFSAKNFSYPEGILERFSAT